MPKLNLKEATGAGPDSIGAPTIDAFDTLKPGGMRNNTEDEEEVVLNISAELANTNDSPESIS